LFQNSYFSQSLQQKCLFFGLKEKYYAQKTIRKTPKKLHLYFVLRRVKVGVSHYFFDLYMRAGLLWGLCIPFPTGHKNKRGDFFSPLHVSKIEHLYFIFLIVVWENIFFGTKTTCFICRCIVLKDTKFVPFTYVYIQRHVRWW
jgi:hypothetical protein